MKFSCWDIEAENWNEFKVASIYNDKKQFICYSTKEIIKRMIEIGGIFYSHYGGGYDNHFLLKDLKKRFCMKWENIGSRLVKISVYYKNSKKKLFELRDSFFILPTSLKKLAIELTDERKQDIDRKHIERLTKKELNDYVLSDSRILFKVITNYLKIVNKQNIKKTIASECFSEHKKLYNHKELRVPAYYDKYIRQSYSGARTEVFKRYGKNLKYYDFKSMYPSVMFEKEFPSGYIVNTKTFIKDKFGIYNCDVVTPDLDIPFLHTYNEDKKLIFPNGSFKGVYTSIEIEKAITLGYKIKILNGYYFTKKARPFQSYIKKWYGLKQKAEDEKNNSLRYISKLYLNSLYGKFGQRRVFRKIIHLENNIKHYIDKGFKVVDFDENLNFIVVEEETRAKYTTCHIASFCCAYARIKLYEAIENIKSLGGEVYYCDTDSIVTNIDLPIGKNLGDLDLEQEIKEGIFLAPKFYSIITKDNKTISKHKGLSDDYDFDLYKKALLYNDFTSFKEKKTSICSLLESKTRHLKHMEVIKKTRSANGCFDKRIITKDFNTKPLNI